MDDIWGNPLLCRRHIGLCSASRYGVVMLSRLALVDLIFVLSAVLFNLLIAGIFIAQKKERPKVVRAFGISWLLLAIPLGIVFVNYLRAGQKSWVLIGFGIVLLYMLVEFLADYVFKFDFRAQWSTHAPYIVLEYAALFGLIGIAINIDQSWGWIVSISFWVLMGSLIYLYWGRKKTG